MKLGFGWRHLQYKAWQAIQPAYHATNVRYTNNFDKLGTGAICDTLGLLPTFRTSLVLTNNTNKTV